MLSEITLLVKDVIAHRGRELVALFIRQELLDHVLGALLEAPEHLLFSVLETECRNTVHELIVTIRFVVVGVDGAVVLEDRDTKFVVGVEVILIITFDLLLDDQALERPVLDLHRVAVVVDVLTVINVRHVVC